MCIKSDHTVEPTTVDVYLSYEDHSSITITFSDPTAQLEAVKAIGDPADTGPTPEQVSPTQIKFFDPQGAVVNFTIQATYASAGLTEDHTAHPMETPVIATIKPRTSCPAT